MHSETINNLKTEAMKRLLLLAILTILFTFAYGQKSIDSLFEKYGGQEGFTTVTIDGNLFKLARCFGNDDEDNDNSMCANITEIRILTQEDETMQIENFYGMVMKDIDLDKYEEFMRVKESDQDLRMLVRADGKRFKEFLLIAGGSNNAVIQIKGDLSFDDAKKLSADARKNNGADIVAAHK
jgi:hypothetical protein